MTMLDTFTAAELTILQTNFAGIQTVNPDRLPAFRQMFDRCSDAALTQLANANIKFISKLAVNACARRGVDPYEARESRADRQNDQ